MMPMLSTYFQCRSDGNRGVVSETRRSLLFHRIHKACATVLVGEVERRGEWGTNRAEARKTQALDTSSLNEERASN